MNNDELIRFNPILAKALAETETAEPPEAAPYLRELVALCVKTGVRPSVIYAMIKTGRMVTQQNMKLLSKSDLKEWRDAYDEYDRLEKGNR